MSALPRSASAGQGLRGLRQDVLPRRRRPVGCGQLLGEVRGADPEAQAEGTGGTVSGEVTGCRQIEFDRHRWYVDIRITLEDGTDVHKVYAATSDGIQEYESAEEWERENW
jgi:hypothetical protein